MSCNFSRSLALNAACDTNKCPTAHIAAISAPVNELISVIRVGGGVVNASLHTLHTLLRVSSFQNAGCVGACTTTMRCHRSKHFACMYSCPPLTRARRDQRVVLPRAFETKPTRVGILLGRRFLARRRGARASARRHRRRASRVGCRVGVGSRALGTRPRAATQCDETRPASPPDARPPNRRSVVDGGAGRPPQIPRDGGPSARDRRDGSSPPERREGASTSMPARTSRGVGRRARPATSTMRRAVETDTDTETETDAESDGDDETMDRRRRRRNCSVRSRTAITTPSNAR